MSDERDFDLGPEGEPERPASHTALGVAIHRAAHLILDEPPPILRDTVTLRLLGTGAEARIRAGADRLRHPAALAFRSHLLLRSRFAEDIAAQSAAAGVGQLVSLGAGLDTFAYRQPDWARSCRFFEVDHPASQSAKLERLAAAGIPRPGNLAFAPVDLVSGSLSDGLTSAGFDPAAPAAVSCLGVLMYLDPKTVAAIFAAVAGMAPGTRFVLSFARPAVPGRDHLAEAAARSGEPWLTRLEPDDLVAALRHAGFAAVELLSSEDAQERYFAGRTDGLKAPSRVNLAVATAAEMR